MIKWLKSLFFYLSPLVLGAMLTFAFAPYDVYPLAVVAPACLLLLLRGASPQKAFWLSYLFGIGLFGTGTYWVYISINVYGDIPFIFSVLITAIFVGFVALYPGITGYLNNRYFPSLRATILAFPAIWVLFEWIRSWLFSGFPWLFIGYSQTTSPLRGFAPILSVYGVSMAALLSSSLLVNAVLQFRKRRYLQTYFSLFFILILWLAGASLSLIDWTYPKGSPVQVSLVQGNIRQEIKWSPEYLQQSLDRYDQLTRPLWGKDKLVIWPEAAIPLPLQNASDYINQLDEKAKASGTHLILGIPIQAADSSGYYNALVTLGDTKQVYLKRRLVPFGEFVPFANLIMPYLNALNIPVANSIPGKYQQPPLIFGDLKLLTAICYEIAFPELAFTRDGQVSAILTVTNDAWFGESNAQAQHLEMGAMRALELQRPVIFVSNNGITAVLGPNGNIEAAIPPRRTSVLNSRIQPMTGITPWMHYGMDPLLLTILISLIVAGILQARATDSAAVSAPRRRGKRARRSRQSNNPDLTPQTNKAQ